MRNSISSLSLAVLVALIVVAVKGGVVKRSFVQLGCMGENDKSAFAYLDRICEECYNLFREPGLHQLCSCENDNDAKSIRDLDGQISRRTDAIARQMNQTLEFEIGQFYIKSYCFKNDYFEGCMKALLLEEEKALIDERVNKLFGGS